MNDKARIKLLEKNYSELLEHLQALNNEMEILNNDLEYMSNFISYHRLDDAYLYFRENAHRETDPELPFSFLTL